MINYFTKAKFMSESVTENGGQTASRISDTAKETASRYASSAAESTQVAAQHFVSEPAKDIFGLLRDYARDKPDVCTLWAFGLGVVVGWKLRP
jgi:hypothetical protein